MLKDTTLKNGIRVVVYEKPEWPVESLGIWFKFGYRDELLGEESWAHLLEHLMANGSEKYPTEIDQARIATDTGSFFNASTWLEFMNLRSEFLPEYYDVFFDFVADKVNQPVLTQEAIEREKKIINEEYIRDWGNPETVLRRYSLKSLFNGTSLSYVPIGKEYAIGEVTEEKMRVFYGRLLKKAQMIVVACGPISQEKILEKVSNYFGNLETDYQARTQKVDYRPVMLEVPAETKGAKLTKVSFLTVPYTDKKSPVFSLASAYLSLGKDSELFRELRIKRGLVYQISAENSLMSDTGYFSIFFPSTQTQEVIKLVFEKLKEIPETMDEAKLKLIKQRLINSRKRNFSRSAETIQTTLGYSLIQGDIPETEEEFERRVNSVDLETFKKTVKEYLDPARAIVLSTK